MKITLEFEHSHELIEFLTKLGQRLIPEAAVKCNHPTVTVKEYPIKEKPEINYE